MKVDKMIIEKLKNQDKLEINGKIYEVLWVRKEVTVPPEDYRVYLEIALHDVKSLSLHPDCELQYFLDNGETIFYDHQIRIKIDIKDIEKVT